MSDDKPIRRVAIIGTGVIGASWTALFLAKGLEVVATDVAPDAETSLRRFVKAAPARHKHVSRSRKICRLRFDPQTSSRRTAPNASISRRSCTNNSTSYCRPT